MNGHLCALSDQLRVFFIQELLQVSQILRLTGHCCQSFVSHDVLFVVILDALPDEALKLIDANLTKYEAYFMLEQAALGFIVIF